MKQFKLPEPDTRIVVCGNHVFKVKYKISQSVEVTERVRVVCKGSQFQKDLQCVTASVLTHLLSSDQPLSMRTNTTAVYTGIHPWPQCKSLYFAHNNHQLPPYPNVVLFLITPFTSTLPLPHLYTTSGVPDERGGCPPGHKLGKHTRGSGGREKESQHPGGSSDVPSMHTKQSRKHPRLEAAADEAHTLLPAAMPVGSMSEMARDPPSVEDVEKFASETKAKLRALSLPTCPEGIVEDEGQEPSSFIHKATSTLQDIVKWT